MSSTAHPVADAAAPDPADAHAGALHTRRDFFPIFGGALAGLAALAAGWTLLDSVIPNREAEEASAVLDVDVSKLAPDTQMIVLWQGHPVLIQHRSPATLLALQQPSLTRRLLDPNSDARQQPDYVRNWHRSLNPAYGVLVGTGPGSGCVPALAAAPSPDTPIADWVGGYVSPCERSYYDMAGRVFRGSVSRWNMAVPPYDMLGASVVRLGGRPGGIAFDVNSVDRL